MGKPWNELSSDTDTDIAVLFTAGGGGSYSPLRVAVNSVLSVAT